MSRKQVASTIDSLRDAVETQANSMGPIMNDQSPCPIQIQTQDEDGEAGDDPPSSGRVDPATLARFWSKVNKNGPVPFHRPALGKCWLWTAGLKKGYGQFALDRDLYGAQNTTAHRFAYELTYGRIPTGLHACHHCDRPACVRPSHLFAGTPKQNLDDARRKGRLVDGAHLIKVDAAGIADILTNYRPRHNGKQLAAKYGITLISLCRIVNGTQRVHLHTAQSRPVAPGLQCSDVVGVDR